jgi:hypothetical protein
MVGAEKQCTAFSSIPRSNKVVMSMNTFMVGRRWTGGVRYDIFVVLLVVCLLVVLLLAGRNRRWG